MESKRFLKYHVFSSYFLTCLILIEGKDSKKKKEKKRKWIKDHLQVIFICNLNPIFSKLFVVRHYYASQPTNRDGFCWNQKMQKPLRVPQNLPGEAKGEKHDTSMWGIELRVCEYCNPVLIKLDFVINRRGYLNNTQFLEEMPMWFFSLL